MVTDAEPIDISTIPELVRLAREVAASGRSRLLRDGDTDVAVIAPAPPQRRRRRGRTISQADIDAALAVAGAWKDWIDPEAFKRERRELQSDYRPIREL
jgi:hypothetical protein